MKKPYRDFDLPNRHLTEAHNHYVPPKARSSSEIERRHELPRGTVLAEQQLRGIAIAGHVLTKISDEPDVHFATAVLAPASLNTAWYSFARRSDVMRRRLKLPILRNGWFDEAPNSTMLLFQSQDQLSDLMAVAGLHVAATMDRSPRLTKLSTAVGRLAGEAALHISCVEIADQLPETTPFVAQDMARIASLKTLQVARKLHADFDTPPSLAQLADPDSDLAVHIRRHAPNGAYEAYDEALGRFAITR